MRFYPILFLLIVLTSCQKEGEEIVLRYPEIMEIPVGFPDIEFPEDNEYTLERWKLGKQLFFDPVLSVDSSLSCASCHKPELAFSDDRAFSAGVKERPGSRNAPSLTNVGYHPYFTREGGVPTLEMQVLVPIQEHNEFDFNIVLIAERLMQDSAYRALSKKAYDRLPDAFVITRALACFERSLLSGNSRYDQYRFEERQEAITVDEINGMDLFFSKRTNCSQCHGGFNFSNYQFENNGLYEHYLDEGRFRLTSQEQDRALFKVPGLRNIELTAPYMHDGSIESLEDVIEHYQSGGKDHLHKSELIKPLSLTSSEKNDLVLFLKSLTDHDFVGNPNFKN
jgi:cytochrome c peroxidase